MAGLFVLTAACTDAGGSDRRARESERAHLTARDGEWRLLASPQPHVPSLNSPAAWTGTELIVWGGAGPNPNSTGASYSPETDRWEDLPLAPAGPRSEHTAVWTGAEVLFWGRNPAGAGPAEGPAGVAYNPKTRSWRVLADAPIPDRLEHQAVWTGEEMVVWGGLEGVSRPHESVLHAKSAAAYDPAGDSWRELPDVPPSWSGEGGEALTIAHKGRALIYRSGEIALLNEEHARWEKLGDSKPGRLRDTAGSPYGVESVTGIISGDELFVWSGDSGRYRGHAISMRTGKWRDVADRTFWAPPSELAAAPGSLFVAADDGRGRVAVSRYDIASDRWEDLGGKELGIAPGPSVIWTGQELLATNGYRIDDGPRTSAAFGPRSEGPAR